MPLAIQQDQKYTYGHYQDWPDDERWELINGIPYAMTAPSRSHQRVVFELSGQIRNALIDSDGEGYVAPFDVRLPENEEADELVETVVQPDLVVVCDQDKLDEKGCRGAPDWVIEVISPLTALVDLNYKHDLYEKHGVKEYWIVHPLEKWVMVYVLQDNRLYGKPVFHDMSEPVMAQRMEGLEIDWAFLADAA